MTTSHIYHLLSPNNIRTYVLCGNVTETFYEYDSIISRILTSSLLMHLHNNALYLIISYHIILTPHVRPASAPAPRGGRVGINSNSILIWGSPEAFTSKPAKQPHITLHSFFRYLGMI
jgi:hypothetical protein